MKMKRMGCSVLLCAMGAVPVAAVGQSTGQDGPPSVLVIQREFTKPGKAGASHEKTEGGFIAAAKLGKTPIHYFAITSLSGPDRALFFSGYPNFAAWEAERKSVEPAVGAAMDKANVADGDLLAMSDASAWTLRADLSLNMGNLVGKRYLEIQQFMLKPGHQAEFTELAKMFVEAYKNVPGTNWTTFEQMYGTNGGGMIAITSLASLADVDTELLASETAMKSMDKEQRKKVHELEAASIASQQTNLFALSPKMSLPPDAWVKAEPDFWTPKTAPVKKTAAKPAP